MELEVVKPSQQDQVLQLFLSAPTYFLNVDGCLPTLHTVRESIAGRPANRLESYRREFLFIKKDGQVIGGVELHADHPEIFVAYIGLLIIREDLHGRDLGRLSYIEVENYIRRRFNCRRVRLGVSDENDTSGFWAKMGFRADGREYAWIGERKVTNVVEYEKTIAEPRVITPAFGPSIAT